MNEEIVSVTGASSLERLVPEEIVSNEATGAETMALHMERYEWASSLISDCHNVENVLDAACGVGYGSSILAESNTKLSVTGLDIDRAAIEYAAAKYGSSGVKFITQDLSTLETSTPYDAIVSFETIEHVPDPLGTIDTFARLLPTNGLLILSVPVTPSVDVNPYHLTDFTSASIRDIVIRAGFNVINEFEQVQRFSPIKIVTRSESRLSDMRSNLLKYYAANPAAAVKRVAATLRFGFTNRYLSLACRKN